MSVNGANDSHGSSDVQYHLTGTQNGSTVLSMSQTTGQPTFGSSLSVLPTKIQLSPNVDYVFKASYDALSPAKFESNDFANIDATLTAVPEPSAFALLAVTSAMMLRRRARGGSN